MNKLLLALLASTFALSAHAEGTNTGPSSAHGSPAFSQATAKPVDSVKTSQSQKSKKKKSTKKKSTPKSNAGQKPK